ncbi:hypothetical protein [Actinacidiphila yeochonensis]|uniref:hypothetical protein n=1 Tax=Actinacidiphila yeochonensis TaxID=89050 RepID=UPI00055D00AF|nr:hypothetical protein [Actinacidiphila yeochonensis]
MPSDGHDAQPAYYQPMPVQAPYVQGPVQSYGQHLPQPNMAYPPSVGIDGVVMGTDQFGRPVAYYTQPPALEAEPLITPLMAKMALAAFILGMGGVGVYFLAMALATLIAALTMFIAVLAGGAVAVSLISAAARSRGGTRVQVQARGRARVQVHTGRGHNRGRR